MGSVGFYYGALFFVCRADRQAAYILNRLDSNWLKHMSQVFVHNGVLLHATWSFIVVIYHLCVVMQHLINVEGAVASLFFYPVYLIHLFISFSLEVCMVWFHLRWLFAHYIAYMFAPIGGIIMLHYADPDLGPISGKFRELHLILLGFCLGLAVLCLLIKVAVCIGRRHHTPHSMTPSRPSLFSGPDRTTPLSLHKV